MKEKILELIEAYPKHFSQKIKRDNNLYQWVIDNSPECNILAERIYLAISNETKVCNLGNKKKFKSITSGYGFCGRAKQCECAREHVSQEVKKTKSKFTPNDIKKSNDKREQTCLKKYGVTNNGQTSYAKKAHDETYKDVNKVAAISLQIANTKINRYGDAKYNNSEQTVKTCIEKYGVNSALCLRESNQNPNLSLFRDKDMFTKIFEENTIEEIAEKYNVHIQTVYRYSNAYGLREKFRSVPETELVNFLKENGITNIDQNTRKLLPSKKEIDIYLPDYDLAIEFNGVYWHNEEIPHITKYYHYDKYIECEKLGIHLITLFSYLWDNNRELVKEKILYKLGKANSEKIYARKCTISMVLNSEIREFLNNTHIQGYTTSKYCFGLFFGDKMVSVMTFSNSRPGIGKKHNKDTYELVRYSSSQTVVGGASKLFKHFVKAYCPELIVSYSDNEWNTGKMYEKMGFDLYSVQKSNYWYYHPAVGKFEHRYNYTKYKLIEKGFDPNLTERVIMQERGFYRIWDCGNKVWHWKPQIR